MKHILLKHIISSIIIIRCDYLNLKKLKRINVIKIIFSSYIVNHSYLWKYRAKQEGQNANNLIDIVILQRPMNTTWLRATLLSFLFNWYENCYNWLKLSSSYRIIICRTNFIVLKCWLRSCQGIIDSMCNMFR